MTHLDTILSLDTAADVTVAMVVGAFTHRGCAQVFSACNVAGYDWLNDDPAGMAWLAITDHARAHGWKATRKAILSTRKRHFTMPSDYSGAL